MTMVVTIFHIFIAFLFFIPFKRRIEALPFFVASILPDAESSYYAFEAALLCKGDWPCLYNFQTHYLLHSILGVLMLAFFIAGSMLVLKKHFPKKRFMPLFASAVFGGLTHLFVDLFKNVRMIAPLFPLPYRFVVDIPFSREFWIGTGIIGFVYFLYVKRMIK